MPSEASRKRLADAYETADTRFASSFTVIMRQVVGEVTIDPHGDGPPPHVVAFELIALNDTPGTYEFPMADGRTCHVDVAYVEGEQYAK